MGSVFACETIGNENEKKFFILFPEEHISLENFEILEKNKNPYSDAGRSKDTMSMLILNSTLGKCEEKLSNDCVFLIYSQINCNY